MSHKKRSAFEEIKAHLRLRGKVTGVSPSIALLHEIADHFGYQYEALSHLRTTSIRKYGGAPSIYYLKRAGWVRARRIGNRLEVCITADGVHRVWRDRLKAVTQRLGGGWVYIIIFDFPESERSRRGQWRQFLKWLGVRYLQKSVWYTDREIGEELARMVKREGLDEWVHVLKAQILTKT